MEKSLPVPLNSYPEKATTNYYLCTIFVFNTTFEYFESQVVFRKEYYTIRARNEVKWRSKNTNAWWNHEFHYQRQRLVKVYGYSPGFLTRSSFLYFFIIFCSLHRLKLRIELLLVGFLKQLKFFKLEGVCKIHPNMMLPYSLKFSRPLIFAHQDRAKIKGGKFAHQVCTKIRVARRFFWVRKN